MKKEYVIRLTVDPSKATDEGSDTFIPRGEDPREFKIVLNPNDPTQPILEVAAHELGHVLGRIFKTPAQKFLAAFGIESLEFTERKFNSEVDAWDIAEKMVPIQPMTRKIALDTYRR